MAPNQFKELSELLDDAIQSDKLNAWQMNFIRSFSERVEAFQERTYVSDKQLAALRGIQITLYGSASLEIT